MSIPKGPELFGGRLNRKAIQSPVNPNDLSTIVSIYNKIIREIRPTVFPGQFFIPPGSPEKPSSIVVGPSVWWHNINLDMPPIEVVNNSIQIAESITRDWANGLLAANPPDIMPGVFWVPGKYTVKEVREKFPSEFEKAIKKQKRWYSALIELGDAAWARSGGNPMAISEDMRIAAREMNIMDKDWMKNFQALSKDQCFACGSLKDPGFPVCPTCKAIDPEHPKAKNLQFAS